jgi:hypothetical protein
MINSSVTIGTDGRIYVGVADTTEAGDDVGKLYALTTTATGLAQGGWPMYANNAQHTGNVSTIAECIPFNIDLGADQEIAEGSSVEIGVEPVEGIIYSWSSGETTSKITVDAAGEYILTGTSNCESIIDTVAVTVITSVGLFSESQIQVYPNPVTEKLFIKGLEGEFYTEIISISGAIVRQEDNSHELNISDIHSGLYILRISLKDSVFVKPFTKE